MARVLLVSTYELGHQPLHVASPAGALRRAGHEVRAVDLTVTALDAVDLDWAQAVAISVPMHTALRLALEVGADIRRRRRAVALCLYGLYAAVAEAGDGPGRRLGVDLAITAEYEPALVGWADSLGGDHWRPPGARSVRSVRWVGRTRFGTPARRDLPPLERYARLAVGGEERLAGYVEASHGCAHRCRHCPVPVAYDGRTRLVGVETVVADVAELRSLGARHVTFGDPDFLNGPHHARRVVDAVHGAFPDLTFDVTAKVEHVLRHGEVWRPWAASGLLFVVCAFECATDEILRLLDKGHTVADEIEAVAVLRGAGVEVRPSLLPFTPWTTGADVRAILDLVAYGDLVGNVDPVQYAIRLLVPPGSLLLGSGALEGRLGPYDADGLSWTWRSPDPRLDDLQQHLATLAARAGEEGWSSGASYDAVRGATAAALGGADTAAPSAPARLRSSQAPDDRPRLTEAWFCCAEPTAAHFAAASQPASAGRS